MVGRSLFPLVSLSLPLSFLVGCGSGQKGGDVLLNLLVSVASDLIDVPTDATPSFDGDEIYFTTDGEDGSGVYLAGSGPDDEATALATTSRARGVVATEDSLFIADLGADSIFSLPFDGGELTPLLVDGDGTAITGFLPVALDGSDGITFAGTDPTSGEAGIFHISTDGGTPTTVGTGFDGGLSGVVVADDGTIYATGDDDGLVYEIEDGEAVIIQEDVNLGSPAGIALNPDEDTIMVSSLDNNGHSQVLLINRESLDTSAFNGDISENTASGGLHRALGAPRQYAWADSTAGGQGRVYRIEF